jgi:CBS domain-containing protein
MREYSVDPLEATFVREVMETDILTVDPDALVADVYASLPEGSLERRQRLYPVMDVENTLVGVLPWSAVLESKDEPEWRVRDAMKPTPVTAFADEILRSVADRMAAEGVSVVVVVDREDPTHFDGLVNQFDLLRAREKLLVEERHTERVLTLRPLSRRNEEPVSQIEFLESDEDSGIV